MRGSFRVCVAGRFAHGHRVTLMARGLDTHYHFQECSLEPFMHPSVYLLLSTLSALFNFPITYCSIVLTRSIIRQYCGQRY